MSYYFIYKIDAAPGGVLNTLEKVERFENYQAAKKVVRSLRGELPAGSSSQFKIIFAENELEAEDRLQEKREAPIVQEWEK